MFKGNDICSSEPFNLRRIKSNGFLITKQNEVIVENLVPYTKYNITFSSLLHEKDKVMFITTAESGKRFLFFHNLQIKHRISELPTPEELPNNIQIQVTDTTAHVSWDKIDCRSTYGHIIYALNVTNLLTNSTKELNVQTENTVEINDLESYTPYKLDIVTSRNFENIQNNTNSIAMSINFTTKPGLAQPIRHLEVYSIDKNSVSFRYDLPAKSSGTPTFIQVTRCNPLLFKNCKSSVSPIMRCKLWPKKFCVDANNLIPFQRHTFKLSIKNDLTHNYGKDVQIDTFTMDKGWILCSCFIDSSICFSSYSSNECHLQNCGL